MLLIKKLDVWWMRWFSQVQIHIGVLHKSNVFAFTEICVVLVLIVKAAEEPRQQ